MREKVIHRRIWGEEREERNDVIRLSIIKVNIGVELYKIIKVLTFCLEWFRFLYGSNIRKSDCLPICTGIYILVIKTLAFWLCIILG